MDLEQIIDELVYRKRTASDAERQLINRILTGLRYSYEDACGIIEDLDRDWGATCRPLAASTATGPRQVLPADFAGFTAVKALFCRIQNFMVGKGRRLISRLFPMADRAAGTPAALRCQSDDALRQIGLVKNLNSTCCRRNT